MAKVKVDVSVVAKVSQKFEKALKAFLPSALEIVGSESVRLIKGRTRQGADLTAGNRVPAVTATLQPPLGDPWVKRRKQLAAFNQTHPVYSPKRSNLSFTGQLLDALAYKRVRNVAQVFVSPTPRKAYAYVPKKGPNKGRTVNAKAPDNRKLAGYLAEQGRFFVGLSDAERTIISNRVTQLLRRGLRAFDF